MKELQYNLRLKEAEAEDNRLQEAHTQRIKELELDQLDEAFEAAEFEKQKTINQVKRNQEIELSELEANNRKQVNLRKMDAALKILGESGMEAVPKSEWEAIRAQATDRKMQDEAALSEARRKAEEELKRAYNITTAELFDVTELYYREKSLARSERKPAATREAGSGNQTQAATH